MATPPSPAAAADLMPVLLPPMFSLRELAAVDDVVAEAGRQAADGADEGTVVVATEQTAGRSVGGNVWRSFPGNVHLALVLQPEYSNAVLADLAVVATVAAGEATAELLEPMTGLRYRAPTSLMVNELLAGQVRLLAPAGSADPAPWLVVGFCLNVAEHPPNPEPERYNSMYASGTTHVGSAAVVEGFCRHFLRWINTWADDGITPAWRAYTTRLDVEGGADAASLDRTAYLGEVAKLFNLPRPTT